MNILALDTATEILSLALAADGLPRGAVSTNRDGWYMEADLGLRHSEFLMEMTDTLLKNAGMEPADLDLVACMGGPGSFTGLRIGFSAAKGIALALGIPLAASPTLDCMALSCLHWPGAVLPVIDAKKRRFFTALYRGGGRISSYLDGETAEIGALIPKEGQTLLTGPGAPELASLLDDLPPERILIDPGCRKGRARELLAIVKKKNIILDNRETLFTGPMYLRKSDAELTKQLD
ncbi:MAG: tRNA (adenosine(37)-N6)-threonylcarbamoyltransferase complex dimerization subunit type 1 TsaB [Treponema sp.]|jgi:tRNA threonylcarbamoyladenosine biosynthesis protein TsaB|nr:tRNA (adenosine(37)-N6)-threonylcarbamoyltransferase complex dimerization subunit type 1 TsaB [Treponema sp.]